MKTLTINKDRLSIEMNNDEYFLIHDILKRVKESMIFDSDMNEYVDGGNFIFSLDIKDMNKLKKITQIL